MTRAVSKNILGALLTLILSVAFSACAIAEPSEFYGQGVMLQGFGWNCQAHGAPGNWYRLITERADSIKQLGIDLVWFAPVSRSVSPQGYLPGDYYDLGSDQNPTFYGNQRQLSEALAALNSRNISPIADIVINHRCAGEQDHNGIWNIYHFPSGKAKWEQWAVVSGQFGGTGNHDSGESYHAAPDIDHTNFTVQTDIIEWLNWLKSLGFKGWRYDYVKGYGVKYSGMYDMGSGVDFSVGEIWSSMSYQGSSLNPDQNHHRQILADWLDQNESKSATLFDFTTKGILQVAVQGEYWRLKDSEGKASGLIGWWPTRAVTFIDNHDTGSQQSHWPFPHEKVMQGYAYILTHPGIPCVFWEHVYDWKLYEPIQKLIKIRKQNKIHSGSELKIVAAEQGLYAAIIDDRIAMKIGWKEWNPGAGWRVLASGDQHVVWGRNRISRH